MPPTRHVLLGRRSLVHPCDSDLGQRLVGSTLLVERLLQQRGSFIPSQLLCERTRRAVRRDLVMLDALGGADQRGVLRGTVAVSLDDLLTLADQSLHSLAVRCLHVRAEGLKHLLEPLHMTARLTEVL